MIAPLKIGNINFLTNIIQGPLAGVSCAPFRRLVWKYSQPAFTCTEMISCKTLIHQSKFTIDRFVAKATEEGSLCFQLSANNPQELAEATKIATGYGADLIDLNCGCPVKKIRSKGAGSSLLTNAPKLYQMIRAMKQSTHLPVSIKIRVEIENEKFNAEIAKVVREAGADFLVVHGRHWTQHYETPCRHDEIRFFVNEVKIPVIGNGDIACLESLKRMFATGCAGVMIARAGVGQPWLIQKLTAEMKNENFIIPSLPEIGLMFIEHIEHLAILLGNEKFALQQARKFTKYYARDLVNRSEFCELMNTCESLSEAKSITSRYF